MNALLPFAIWLATQLGGPDAIPIARAAARACDDTACVADELVWAKGESNLTLSPRAFSWDSKRGLATGPFQLWNAPKGLDAQAVRWARLRTWSLSACGNLAGVASGRCDRGTRLAKAREDEALGWLAAP
jgi:hypothetical protein